jgi:hypothetical protein
VKRVIKRPMAEMNSGTNKIGKKGSTERIKRINLSLSGIFSDFFIFMIRSFIFTI